MLARALPPMRPSATAAAFFPSSVTLSSISPVAMRATITARWLASAGGFSPLGPLGTLSLVIGYDPVHLSHICGNPFDFLVGYISLTGTIVLEDFKATRLQHLPLHLKALTLALAPV